MEFSKRDSEAPLAMSTEILMPALAPTMEKANLLRWLKGVGDEVQVGDVLVEVETDKATLEVEAPAAGVLARILVPEGTPDVPVNEVIGVLSSGGVTISAAPPVETAPLPAPPVVSEIPAPRSNGVGGTVGSATPAERIFASPLARRLMVQEGIDPRSVVPTGFHGRIVERDVKAALARHNAVRQESRASAPVECSASSAGVPKPASLGAAAMFPAGSFEIVPHEGMRRTIARRLAEAKRTIPHFYLNCDCRLDALLELRQQLNAAAAAGPDRAPAYRLSVNDFIVRALALALMAVPDANVSFTEDALIRHRHADIGVAVALPGGLVTPILRHAEAKPLSAISNEIKALAHRARDRRLRPDEYQGGTATVSNLGMYGVRDFAAIINPPQATVLAIGAAEQRIVPDNGAPAVATVMTVTLSADHRAVDGAVAAALLSEFKALIEKPVTMLV